ncbi:MAG: hypothetical protein QOE33_2665 [Acidobacteriota bacterium]|nr:hypothetical protein [Acidobacteriota bacterium]
MEEIQQNYTQGATDAEATLVQPRFDVSEEQTAQPVVPLARPAASWQRRRLPLTLVLVSALIGGLVSVVAYRLYQRASQPRAAQQVLTSGPQPAPSPELTASAPAKEEAAPVKATAASTPHASVSTEEAKNEAGPATMDEARTRATATTERDDERVRRAGTEAATPRVERRSDEGAAREDRQRGGDEVDRAHRDQPRARRVDVITSPEAERVGHDRRRNDGDATDNPNPFGGREGRHERRIKGRNIDRIRDIFGAPPPA